MNTFMTATKARKNFYAVINEVGHPGVAVAITHAGTPKVVIMSFEEYEGWQETMEIMADPTLDKELEEAMKEMKAGNLHKNTISLNEVKKRLPKKRRKKLQHLR
jgi:antitoxin YefM